MKTHFGFQSVPRNKKASLVSDVFSKVACKYDLMNDLISFGMHRIWKKFLVHHSRVFIGSKILDLAGGTGDLSIQFSRLVGASGLVFLVDINASMLQIGRNKLRNLGIINNVMYVQADAENLPFAENIFDYVVVSFGLRNFTNKEKALFSIYRVLKSGGKLLILDFSMPTSKLLNIVYDFYSFHLIPKIGSIVAHTTSSYRYLVESIRMHSNQEVLKNMILEAGFNEVKYFNMTFGIVSLHCACKY